MGRVSKYKREKRTFDVDNLYGANESRDDPIPDPSKQSRLRGKDARAARGKLIVKFGADGNPLNGPKKRGDDMASQKVTKKSSKKSGSTGGDDAGKTEMDRAGFKIEGKRANETHRDFILRVNRETQAELARQRRGTRSSAVKGKAYLRRRKEKEREKRLAKQRQREGDMDEKERKIYQQEERNKRRRVNDVADAPPEFEESHVLRKRASNPSTNRDRFAKLSFAAPIAGGAGASSSSSSGGALGGKSDYEKLQLEQMRERVQARYAEVRKRRREQSTLE